MKSGCLLPQVRAQDAKFQTHISYCLKTSRLLVGWCVWWLGLQKSSIRESGPSSKAMGSFHDEGDSIMVLHSERMFNILVGAFVATSIKTFVTHCGVRHTTEVVSQSF
jgi:hypothetical protein